MEPNTALLILISALSMFLVLLLVLIPFSRLFRNERVHEDLTGRCFFSTNTGSVSGIVYLKVVDVAYGLCSCETIEPDLNDYSSIGLPGYHRYAIEKVVLPEHYFIPVSGSKWVEISPDEYCAYREGAVKMNYAIATSIAGKH